MSTSVTRAIRVVPFRLIDIISKYTPSDLGYRAKELEHPKTPRKVRILLANY